MILVIGATGTTGREVARQLAANGPSTAKDCSSIFSGT